MITLPNVPAYSFKKQKKKTKYKTTPGPGDYNWGFSKQKLLKKAIGVVFNKSKKFNFDIPKKKSNSLFTE